MKLKVIKSILLTVGLGSLLTTMPSCDKYLEVESPSTISQEAVFESLSYTQSAINSVYNELIGDDGYGSRLSLTFPMGVDDFRATGSYSPTDQRGFSMFGVSPDNDNLRRGFNKLYSGIERANVCIKYIPQSKLYNGGTAVEQAAMKKLYGEALTLRALYYSELIRNWGDVPATFEPAANVTDPYLPKTNRDEIYDKIIEDLRVASEVVPWSYESGDPSTRITKAAVKGLRARIALAAGGYSLRREPQEMARRADYKKFYQIAKDETNDIIKTNKFGLNPSFENLFRSLHTAARQDPNNEWIFEVGAFGGNANSDSKLGYGNGLVITKGSSWGQANGGVCAMATYFYEFDSLDVRRDVTLVGYTIDINNNKIPTTLINMRDGKFRKPWTGIRDDSQNLGINWPVLRYADVLLMYAEAENELNGPTAEAQAKLKEVRRRALLASEWAVKVEQYVSTAAASSTSFFEAIVQERLLEFGGEGIRKYDLTRWNLLERVFTETRAKLTELSTQSGRYSSVPKEIYYKTSAFTNLSVPAEQNSMLLYFKDVKNGTLNQVAFNAAPATTPAGYTSISWGGSIATSYISGDTQGFGRFFVKNWKELLPLPTSAITQNYRLTQDYGYASYAGY